MLGVALSDQHELPLEVAVAILTAGIEARPEVAALVHNTTPPDARALETGKPEDFLRRLRRGEYE